MNRGGAGEPPTPHSIIFVREAAGGASEANEAAHPGMDAAFVGEGDACFAVLEPGGMSVGVFG